VVEDLILYVDIINPFTTILIPLHHINVKMFENERDDKTSEK